MVPDSSTSDADLTTLHVALATDSDAAAWGTFVQEANDGNLYHELPFLAYHPIDRFNFEHLIVRRGSQIIAVVPGGVVMREGRTIFFSPLGASVGGPVLSRPLLSEALEVVEALQEYARERGWSGLEFVLSPAAYQKRPSDTTGFALLSRGFRLAERDLSFIVPLTSGKSDAHSALFGKKRAFRVRAALRRGVRVIHGGVNLLKPFLEVFHDTYERHGVTATHSEAEIGDLLIRLPDRVQVWLAMLDDIPVSGILVFRLNARSAATFYICSSTEHSQGNALLVTFAALIDHFAEAGVSQLDLGPSASLHHVNRGVVFFKESLGAAGQARDHFSWSRPK